MADCESLGPRDLHIWLCRQKRVASSSEFSREILSRYAPVPQGDWQFRVGKYGKPHITNPSISLEFSLSHSRDWLACAVTASNAIGVDIEFCDPAREFSKLARRFFQSQEYEALQALPAADRGARFYDLWTLKEARVKASGGALGSQLASLGFVLSTPASCGRQSGPLEVREAPASGSCDSGILDTTGRYTPSFQEPHSRMKPRSQEEHHYSLIDLPENYRLATCALHTLADSPQLALYEWRGRDDVQPACHTIKARSSAGQTKTS